MVLVSERSIERMIDDVAPRVEQLTGWDLKLDGLTVKIVDRDQLMEHGMRPKYDFLGVDITPQTESGKKALQFAQKTLPYLIMGLYEPYGDTMLIVPDNITTGTNESGVTKTIGHELVHRGQFVSNPGFVEHYTAILRGAVGSNLYDKDADEDSSAQELLSAQMRLLEGDASFVEKQLKDMYYQDARNKTAPVVNLLSTIMLLEAIFDSNGNGRSVMDKASQYTEGSSFVGGVYRDGGRKAVNDLYDLTPQQLAQKLKQSTPSSLMGMASRWRQ